MRSWILGGLLTAVTVSGVSFIAAGAGNPTHCGPCTTCREVKEPTAAVPLVGEPIEGEVTLKAPVPPIPFVSYDEPPLANPQNRPSTEIIPATFTEPVPTPMPRVAPGTFPLATGNDPY